jgi:hypothetical protein
MLKIYTTIFWIFLLLFSLSAQDNLPVYSSVQYEVQADSLLKTNEPQTISISISSNSSTGIDAYELKINSLKVLWTIVSANLNSEPIWLINEDTNPDKENVLAWNYDPEENLLRVYPSDWQAGYDLELITRMSLLQPGLIDRSDSKNLSLETELGGVKYRCLPRGSGDNLTFKRKAQNTR